MNEKLFADITRKAHKLTKQIKAQYPEVDYRVEFTMCFKAIYESEKNNNKATKEKILNSDNKVKYEKGSKHLLNEKPIEIIEIFEVDELEMIKFIFLDSGIIEIKEKFTLIDNIVTAIKK